MNYIDLTRTVSPNTPVYPGDPCPTFHKLNDLMQDGFEMYEVTSGMHVGTHMDAPMHFVANGKQIDEISVEIFFGRGYVGGIDDFSQNRIEVVPQSILLISTGQEQLWGTSDYFTTYPALTMDFAKWCVSKRVKMICVDMPSVDYAPNNIHRLLLEEGILIVENVCNLTALIGVQEFDVIVAPVKYATEAAPCRVIAQLNI